MTQLNYTLKPFKSEITGEEFEGISIDDEIRYLIEWDKSPYNFDTYAGFKLHQVAGWRADNGDVCDWELMFSASIKWDGCTHLRVGNNGYIHLCGKHDIDMFKSTLDLMWEIATPRIKRFDKETAES